MKKESGEESKGWLLKPNVSINWLLISVAIWAGLLIYLNHSRIGKVINNRFSPVVDFHVRDVIGKSPDFSDRIKLYVLDDKTFARMGNSFVLTVEQWAYILEKIAQAKPKAIWIDQIFAKFNDPNGKLEEAVKRIKKLGVPIIGSSMVSHRELTGRTLLLGKHSKKEFKFSKWTPEVKGTRVKLNEDNMPNFFNRLGHFPYGSKEGWVEIFSKVGHIVARNEGYVAGFIRTSEDYAIPHAAFQTADQIVIENGDFHVLYREKITEEKVGEKGPVVKELEHKVKIPVLSNGSIRVNFVKSSQILRKAKNLVPFVKKDQGRIDAKVKKHVKEGDIVAILPLFFTGNSDFLWSPINENYSGGFLPVSLINSYLKNSWIEQLEITDILIVLMALLGGTFGLMGASALSWSLIPIAVVIYFSANMYLFSYHSLGVEWFIPLVGFLGSSLTAQVKVSLSAEFKARTLYQAFGGVVPNKNIKNLINSPGEMKLDAGERVVTLMFIDIAGFSRTAEGVLPSVVFNSLKEIFGQLTEVIHKHEGVVDKTLGDGMLCYFGFQFDCNKVVEGHAQKALAAAVEIQMMNVNQLIEGAKQEKLTLPLRIGLHTSSCFLGDLGRPSRIEYTVVGNGVNFAKRMESACEHNMILMSPTAKDLVSGDAFEIAAFSKRYIRIKHHKELFEAYQYNPFWHNYELCEKAESIYRNKAGIFRMDKRVEVDSSSPVMVHSELGIGFLADFSSSGLKISLDSTLAKGAVFAVRLDSDEGNLARKLGQFGIGDIHVKVRWFKHSENEINQYGVEVLNLSAEETVNLLACLDQHGSLEVKRQEVKRLEASGEK